VKTLTIACSTNEEELTFFVDGKEIAFASYEQHGWSAMDDMCCAMEKLAKALGATIEHIVLEK